MSDHHGIACRCRNISLLKSTNMFVGAQFWVKQCIPDVYGSHGIICAGSSSLCKLAILCSLQHRVHFLGFQGKDIACTTKVTLQIFIHIAMQALMQHVSFVAFEPSVWGISPECSALAWYTMSCSANPGCGGLRKRGCLSLVRWAEHKPACLKQSQCMPCGT